MSTTFAVQVETVGAHAHARVWVGPHAGARGLAGTLVMSPEEAAALKRVLEGQPIAIDAIRCAILRAQTQTDLLADTTARLVEAEIELTGERKAVAS